MKIHLSQINTSVGDIEGNSQKIIAEARKADTKNCDLVVFCEMSLTGYPCEDLWQKQHFLQATEDKVKEICEITKSLKCAILLGAPTIFINKYKNRIVNNSAILIEQGKVIAVINKKTIPNYGVFDEKRYFEASSHLSQLEFRGFKLAILVCEDIWDLRNLYLLQEKNFDAIISINSSPYVTNKHQQRLEIANNFATSLKKPFIYINQVGGQDSLVFDGGSFVLNDLGETVLQMNYFCEDKAEIILQKDATQTDVTTVGKNSSNINYKDNIATSYNAVTLALRDYVQKSGFKKVLLGMSGGIDSALVATIAVDALGCDNVMLYALPSRYSSDESMNDATTCAKNLGVKLQVVSIEKPFEVMLSTLGEVYTEKQTLPQLTQENLQSRLRGNILMALSNSYNALLLSTGNKSELATGYATIYGDMCGAFNPIKDFYKTEIYQLANWRNINNVAISEPCNAAPIPQNIITKAPTAELRFNQKDSDSLPEYDVLDKILFALIDKEKSISEVTKEGFSEELINKVAKLIHFSEYKRRQAVIGCKVSNMSFDKDRRYPINNKFLL